jgi:AraC-like DNA-binding protein
MIDVPVYKISIAINESLKHNFNKLLSRYRVEEAKKRLVNPAHSHLTILAIATDVGFNSKSVFNTAFKEHTGMTPREFREKNSGN